MKLDLDRYTVRARLRPTLLVALPTALAVAAIHPSGAPGWGLLWGLITYCGGTFLLAQFGRDMGRAREAKLFAAWGGPPTTRRLRHRDAPNALALDHYHNKTRVLVPHVHIPTADEEARDPTSADQAYDVVVAFLRAQTVDRERFALIFEENCNYGFRRNLWGMKPLGIGFAILGLLILGALLPAHTFLGTPIRWAGLAAAAVVDVLFLVAWFWWITPAWVRTAAEAYSGRLLEALHVLEKEGGLA